ncbi:helix-turn-helix domain-containing protein [Oceanospirillum sediminis]|uniref:Helix-turn-helix transcriptional regulator n=1 Tax=Oceanospirillum sediminis TaxID=2760088 RepID=A0A839IWX2_9GAMM|nr:helix-turn-helix transcriptional regulator [Oceanospirillum sediminis]MBB1488586.1 helix-turn-helix transcriptional regulator [Oceanospirillum sediminis]
MNQTISRLSVRSYSLKTRMHDHHYCQVVMPLHGVIEIGLSPPKIPLHKSASAARKSTDKETEAQIQTRKENQAYSHEIKARIGPGQGVLIRSYQPHRFCADEKARFLVADLPELPSSLLQLSEPFISVSDSLLSFCQFAEIQLNTEHAPDLESEMFTLFMQLLEKQQSINLYDARIQKVTEFLARDLSLTPPLSELAAIACLSLSQYKHLFRQVTGLSTGQYLTKLRMEKARALLVHSDYPVSLIAHQTGYQDASAFSRRFREYFGEAPRAFR